ncbi:restriction endonuclease subunit S [Andreprevotia chitinilytica]|uniref:restriction endonuclease subunit S n=1 Tax=Andreprevotia chitinilytica TaxID=396808 RepID=UPI000AD02935|nr:restriction endonuclease subunit S [Andreprevotia chitinilytica]
MSQLPKGWAFSSIAELGGLVGGKTPNKSDSSFWASGNVPWVSPKDMKVFNLTSSEDKITDAALTRGGMSLLPTQSVLMVTRSGILSHTFPVAITGIPVTINQDIKAFVPRLEVHTKYFAYHLTSLKSQILNTCSKEGTTVASVETAKLEKLPIQLAPLPEQKRIADKLDATLARVDACRERLNRIPALLKRFRQSVLAAATSGQLTVDWREKNIASEGESNLHLTKGNKVGWADEGSPTDADTNGERWASQTQPNLGANTNTNNDITVSESRPRALTQFRGRNLTELPFDWAWREFTDVAFVASNLQDPNLTPNAFHIAPNHIETGTGRLLEYTTIENDRVTSAKHHFRSGQILYSKIRPNLCKVVIVNFEGLCSADMYPIDAKISTKYLFYWMLSEKFTDWASNAESRTVLPKINQKDLGIIPVPVPTNPEQHEIVRRVETLFAFADRLDARLTAAQTAAERLTPALLAKAFRGELVPQDPNDEPASELLKRLAAQRDAAPKAKRGRKTAA